MSRAFPFRPDRRGADADDGPVDLALICRRRAARADQVSPDDASGAVALPGPEVPQPASSKARVVILALRMSAAGRSLFFLNSGISGSGTVLADLEDGPGDSGEHERAACRRIEADAVAMLEGKTSDRWF
ncbi:hypothetical protein GOL81_32925 [Sinorhizobium medicae]|nr:hypothetical protein [Sinorhizobium medicae]MDX0815902.1 hypothetical protein [Sinorhizobium medicae]MDX1103953.1 hypothetical protein [Sinorhizobium medicae]